MALNWMDFSWTMKRWLSVTPMKLLQDVQPDTLNASATNLAAGATFTGSSALTLGVAGIQVVFKADKTCTIYVDQSGDGTNWDIVDSYLYLPGTNFGVTVQAVGSNYRIRVTNNSSSATTFLRLNVALCPIVEAVPRSLDNHGNLKVSVNELTDKFGFTGQFNPVSSLQVAQPYRLVGTVFGSAIDTIFWTAANGGGAGAASGVANSIATIASGTASGTTGYGKLTSNRSARFIFAHPHKFRAAIRLTAVAVANSSARAWGAVSLGSGGTVVTPQNGAFFSVTAAGVLSVNYVKAGGDIQSVASGSFNGEVSQYILDTSVHAFEIINFTMGIWFFVDGVLLHKVTPTTATLYNTMTVPIAVWSVNDGTGGTTGVVECWNAVIVRLGRDVTAPTSYYIAGATAAGGVALKVGAGSMRSVIWSSQTNASTITIYDGTTAGGTVTGTVLWACSSGVLDAPTASLDFKDMPFFTGLVVVTTGATTKSTYIYE